MFRILKTEHLTGRSTHAFFLDRAPCSTIVYTFDVSSNAPCSGSRLESSCQHVSRVLKTVRLLHSHSSISCSCRNLLGMPERRSTFPRGMETELGISFIDPDGGWFGRMAEQSPLTGYEPKNLIDISSQHHANESSIQEKQFQYRFQRRAHHCFSGTSFCRQYTHKHCTYSAVQHTHAPWLKVQARFAFHLRAPKRILSSGVTCLILGCLICLSPRARHLLHSLFLPRHKNTQHIRYNENNSENTSSTRNAVKDQSVMINTRLAETRATQLPQVMIPKLSRRRSS